MYRDELEAQRARLSTLEAELAQARQRRRELEAAASAARQARQQAMRSSERVQPGRRLRWLAAGLALALCASLILGIRWLNQDEKSAAVARAELAQLKARTVRAQARIAEARAELARELDRCTPLHPR